MAYATWVWGWGEEFVGNGRRPSGNKTLFMGSQHGGHVRPAKQAPRTSTPGLALNLAPGNQVAPRTQLQHSGAYSPPEVDRIWLWDVL